MKHSRPSSLAAAAALTVLFGCSSSSNTASTDAGSGGSTLASNCSSACSNLSTVCGHPVSPTCATECQSHWSTDKATCASGASTCTAAEQCLAEWGDSVVDAGTTTPDAASGTSGGTVSCAPWGKFTDAKQSCAPGCSTAQADDQKSIWCLKPCTTDNDCSGGAVPGSCQPGTGTGNPKVCVPVCANNSQCTSEGWGSTCNMLHNPPYCNGGPAYVF